MNKEEIIRMAKEASGDDWGIFKDFMPEIERFAALVAVAEREECAKVCEKLSAGDGFDWGYAYCCALQIRARGQE